MLLPILIILVWLKPVLLILQYFFRFKISLFPVLILHILQMCWVSRFTSTLIHSQERVRAPCLSYLTSAAPHRGFLRVTEPRFTQERIWIRTVPLRIYLKRLVENENLQILLHLLNPKSRTTAISGRKIFHLGKKYCSISKQEEEALWQIDESSRNQQAMISRTKMWYWWTILFCFLNWISSLAKAQVNQNLSEFFRHLSLQFYCLNWISSFSEVWAYQN